MNRRRFFSALAILSVAPCVIDPCVAATVEIPVLATSADIKELREALVASMVERARRVMMDGIAVTEEPGWAALRSRCSPA